LYPKGNPPNDDYAPDLEDDYLHDHFEELYGENGDDNDFEIQDPILNQIAPLSIRNIVIPQVLKCRQCPGNSILTPSSSSTQNYICSPNENHILCQCCHEPMPNRISRANNYNTKQNCSICFKPYCDIYWKCRNGSCEGCLLKFCDFKIKDNNSYNHILINGNQYESQLFDHWLTKNEKSYQELFNECLQLLKTGIYHSQISPNDLERIVCRQCAFKVFQDIAYQYRSDLPLSQFPKQSSKCRWGKECRTQRHNLDHAK
jgi:hypothetical protein